MPTDPARMVAGPNAPESVVKSIHHQLGLDRPVALKVIAAELANNVDFRSRFKSEAQLAASIDHPNVVPVY